MDYLSSLLVTRDGEKVIEDSLTVLSGKKVIGLLFSAIWCPPCQRFKPQLISCYNALKNSGKEFEIIYISRDKNEQQFNDNFSHMPWTAIPYSERATIQEFCKSFQIQGIPTLVLLDENFRPFDLDGVSTISSDPIGSGFPWPVLTIPQVLSNVNLVNVAGDTTNSDSLLHKHKLIYFSAHWCPPCQAFTPKLAAWYRRQKQVNDDFEIIFVSGDNNHHEFVHYFNTMPWLALPFEAQSSIKMLNKILAIEGIPSLVQLNPDYSVAKKSCVDDVSQNKAWPFQINLVEDISETLECNNYDINSKRSLIAFIDQLDDDDQQNAIEVLKIVAMSRMSGRSEPDEIYFVSTMPSQVANKILNDCKVKKRTAGTIDLVMIDIQNEQKYFKRRLEEVSIEAVSAFVEECANGIVEASRLGE